jgi:hypothetical protein
LHRGHDLTRLLLNGPTTLRDLARLSRRSFRELAHFCRHDREALAVLAASMAAISASSLVCEVKSIASTICPISALRCPKARTRSPRP